MNKSSNNHLLLYGRRRGSGRYHNRWQAFCLCVKVKCERKSMPMKEGALVTHTDAGLWGVGEEAGSRICRSKSKWLFILKSDPLHKCKLHALKTHTNHTATSISICKLLMVDEMDIAGNVTQTDIK